MSNQANLTKPTQKKKPWGDLRIYDHNGFPHCINEITGAILPHQPKHFVSSKGKRVNNRVIWFCADCKGIEFTSTELRQRLKEKIAGKE